MDDQDHPERSWPPIPSYDHLPHSHYHQHAHHSPSNNHHIHYQEMAWPVSTQHATSTPHDAPQLAGLQRYTGVMDLTTAMLPARQTASPNPFQHRQHLQQQYHEEQQQQHQQQQQHLQQHYHQHPFLHSSSRCGVISQQQTQPFNNFHSPVSNPYASQMYCAEPTPSMNEFSMLSSLQYRQVDPAYAPLTFDNTNIAQGFMTHPLDHRSMQGQQGHFESIESPSGSSPEDSLDRESMSSEDETLQMMDNKAVSNPGLTLHTMSSNTLDFHAWSPTESRRIDDDGDQHVSPMSRFVVNSSSLAQTMTFPKMNTEYLPFTSPAHLGDPLASYRLERVHSQHSLEASCTPSLVSPSPASELLHMPSPLPPPSHESPRLIARQKVAQIKSKKAAAKVKKGPIKKVSTAQSKRKGGRLGPLLPEQRRGAGEIRKIRACLRCRFLKKTCDSGHTCAGCKPSHARLWQVPCTRLDVRDLACFLKDWDSQWNSKWNAPYDMQTRMQVVGRSGGLSPRSRKLEFGHDLGHRLDIGTRRVFLDDHVEGFFNVGWEDHVETEKLQRYEIATAPLTVDEQGISMSALSDYLDRHMESACEYDEDASKKFEKIIETIIGDEVETCLMRDYLLSAHKYSRRTNNPLVYKALKLVLTYNLSHQVLFVYAEEDFPGKIHDRASTKYGRTIAPKLVMHKMRVALNEIWRELHKEVLEGLSKLYTGVYNGGAKQKNWATIFIVSYLLLTVWERIQFDVHRHKDTEEESARVDALHNDMDVPAGVILGLHVAISQKIPAVGDWNTELHGAILSNDEPSCLMMSELQGPTDHQSEYITECSEWVNWPYDPKNFNCMTGKYTAKLLARVN